MSSIVGKSTLAKLEDLRKIVLKSAIWVLVGAVIVGALTILFGGSESGDVMGKFMGTLFIVALMMMISVNNFKMVATENSEIQIFALIGLVSNIFWAVLWILLCWNPEWFIMRSRGLSYEMSLLAKFAFVFSYLSALGLFCSNIMNIYEGDKKNMIRPLKITAVVCIVYEMLFATVVTFSPRLLEGDFAERLSMLAGFVGFAWFFIVIAAWILSKNEKNRDGVNSKKMEKKKPEAKPVAPKTDEELRAEIEEKVRREMIEKEVRAEFENAEKRFESGSNSKSDSSSASE